MKRILRGRLEIRHATGDEVTEFALVRGHAVSQDYNRADLFAQLVMRNAERHDLLHRRVVHENLVDLTRRYLFAAAIDDLLQPAGDRDIAFGVLDTLIAPCETSHW